MRKINSKVSELVNQLVDTKLGLTGYNADDEKNITDILNQIMNSKFNKFYRNLAVI